MRRIHLLSSHLLCLIFIFSCTSKKTDYPVVQFISPNMSTIHDLTEKLNVEIDISDDSMIMGYRFWLESSNGWQYFAENKQVNKNNYKILYKFDLSNNITENFSVHMEVQDDDGNTTHEKIEILVE